MKSDWLINRLIISFSYRNQPGTFLFTRVIQTMRTYIYTCMHAYINIHTYMHACMYKYIQLHIDYTQLTDYNNRTTHTTPQYKLIWQYINILITYCIMIPSSMHLYNSTCLPTSLYTFYISFTQLFLALVHNRL